MLRSSAKGLLSSSTGLLSPVTGLLLNGVSDLLDLVIGVREAVFGLVVQHLRVGLPVLGLHLEDAGGRLRLLRRDLHLVAKLVFEDLLQLGGLILVAASRAAEGDVDIDGTGTAGGGGAAAARLGHADGVPLAVAAGALVLLPGVARVEGRYDLSAHVWPVSRGGKVEMQPSPKK